MDTAPGPRRKSAFENVFAQSLIAWRFLGAYACQAGICVVCMMGVSILKALVGVLPLHALRGGVGLQSWRWWLLVLSPTDGRAGIAGESQQTGNAAWKLVRAWRLLRIALLPS